MCIVYSLHRIVYYSHNGDICIITELLASIETAVINIENIRKKTVETL